MTGPLLGCIADDFTGGTDLAGMLVKAGFRTVQTNGVPSQPVTDVDALVVALKSRTNPAKEAVTDSLAALAWLRAQGCRQFYFKYCSTFDSSAKGNIGPVADALLEALGADFTIVCPAFPANKRTIYKGLLFVGDAPLDESPMRHHPLTPMTDANLVRLMAAQTPHKVGLADYDSVRGGVAALRARFAQLRQDGVRHAVVDAIADEDLVTIGAAVADLPLVTAGSGLALGLAQNFPELRGDAASALPHFGGHRAVLSGSCSSATQRQVAAMRAHHPSFAVDPLAIARGEDVAAQALAWAAPLLKKGPVLVYATAAPDTVQAVQAALGIEQAGALVENAMATVAQGLVAEGVERLIVAGGETSGAVVRALDVNALRIGPEIDPGVPWTMALFDAGKAPLALALKSGNFGSDDFFLKAWDQLV